MKLLSSLYFWFKPSSLPSPCKPGLISVQICIQRFQGFNGAKNRITITVLNNRLSLCHHYYLGKSNYSAVFTDSLATSVSLLRTKMSQYVVYLTSLLLVTCHEQIGKNNFGDKLNQDGAFLAMACGDDLWQIHSFKSSFPVVTRIVFYIGCISTLNFSRQCNFSGFLVTPRISLFKVWACFTSTWLFHDKTSNSF